MNTFRVQLLAATRSETLEGVASFVGEDPSGSFGLQAHHVRFMTVLTFGLARLRRAESGWQYLGVPGGLLYFVDNELRISTRRYVMGSDAAAIASTLAREIAAEEQALAHVRRKLRRLEAEMLERMARFDGEWVA
jgi:F-type H+-transporting ATPase subunit epsilon